MGIRSRPTRLPCPPNPLLQPLTAHNPPHLTRARGPGMTGSRAEWGGPLASRLVAPASASSDMIWWSRVLLSHALDAARSY